MGSDPGVGFLERARIYPAYPFPPSCLARHESAALRHTEVFGHRGQGQGKTLGRVADGCLRRCQSVRERPPNKIG